MEFTYKRLEENNLVDLQTVFKNVFKKSLTITYIKEKYDNTLYDGKYLGYLAYNENQEPIGFHGATFYQVEYQGQTITVAQGGDSMTDPRYQGRGLFTKLGEITQELAEKEGLAFIYGFPNQNSYPGYVKKLNWQFTEHMICFQIPVSSIPFEGLCRKLGLNTFYQKWVKHTLKNLLSADRLLASTVINEEYGGVKRDERFYTYKRYSSNYILSIDGCKVWVKINGAILVGDIEDKSVETKDQVLETLKKLAKKLGVQKIIFQASPNTHIDQYLSKLYKGESTFPVGFYDIQSPIPFQKLKFTYGDLDTF